MTWPKTRPKRDRQTGLTSSKQVGMKMRDANWTSVVKLTSKLTSKLTLDLGPVTLVTLLTLATSGCAPTSGTPVGVDRRQQGPTKLTPLPARKPEDLVELVFSEISKTHQQVHIVAETPTTNIKNGCIEQKALKLNDRSALFFQLGYVNCQILLTGRDGTKLRVASTGDEFFEEVANGKTQVKVLSRLFRKGERLEAAEKSSPHLAFETTWARETEINRIELTPSAAATTFEVKSTTSEQDRNSARTATSEQWEAIHAGDWIVAKDGALRLAKGATIQLEYRGPSGVSKTPPATIKFSLRANTDVTFSTGCPRPIGKFVLLRGETEVGEIVSDSNGWRPDRSTIRAWPASCSGVQNEDGALN